MRGTRTLIRSTGTAAVALHPVADTALAMSSQVIGGQSGGGDN
jgi:hypothetical protein